MGVSSIYSVFVLHTAPSETRQLEQYLHFMVPLNLQKIFFTIIMSSEPQAYALSLCGKYGGCYFLGGFGKQNCFSVTRKIILDFLDHEL